MKMRQWKNQKEEQFKEALFYGKPIPQWLTPKKWLVRRKKDQVVVAHCNSSVEALELVEKAKSQKKAALEVENA